jgi:hypothetical protein
MAGIRIKYYDVQINKHAASSKQSLWYMQKEGQVFRTVLAIAQNSAGSNVAVFKCVGPPFYHIYPNHCTIVKEETVEV